MSSFRHNQSPYSHSRIGAAMLLGGVAASIFTLSTAIDKNVVASSDLRQAAALQQKDTHDGRLAFNSLPQSQQIEIDGLDAAAAADSRDGDYYGAGFIAAATGAIAGFASVQSLVPRGSRPEEVLNAAEICAELRAQTTGAGIQLSLF